MSNDGGSMNPQPDTLHDRITALHRPETVTVSVPTFDEFDEPFQKQTRCKECEHYWPCRTATVLAETTTAQPEADAVERADVVSLLDDAIRRVPKIGGAGAIYEAELLSVLRTARAALAAAQPVEPEPCPGRVDDGMRDYDCGKRCGHDGDCGEPEADEREAMAAADALEAAVHLVDDVEATQTLARLADQWRAQAAGFRRSRPEATHTITAEQRDAAWQVLARHGVSAALPSILAALGVTVADTPTQAGDDA